MEKAAKNYKALSVGDIKALGRVTLNSALGLTGAEVSINELPAGVGVPFVHAHKRNEEVYVILEGKGRFFVDGDIFSVEPGSAIRVDPAGERSLKADGESPLRYLCIQTEANSLAQFTENDGIMTESKPAW